MNKLKPYPAMKDSGLPWCPQVPSHWELKPNRMHLRQRKVLVGDRHPEYRLLSLTKQGVIVRDLTDNKGKFSSDMGTSQEVQPGNLVMCLFDVPETPRTLGLSQHAGMITGAYTVFDVENTGTGQWLEKFYISMDDRKALGSLYSGLRNTIPKQRFLGTKTPTPPPIEQAAIVRYLDYVDRRVRRLVRAKRKLIALLTEQKQAIIHRAVTRGLDPDVPLKDSGVEWLGEVPEHWESVSLGVAAQSIQTGPFGSQLHADEYVTGGVPVINPSHMRGGLIEADEAIGVSREKAKELNRHELRAGDIVAARRGELGRCALVTHSESGWLCGTGSLRIRPKKHLFEPSYLVCLIGSQGVRDNLCLASIGATMNNLNAGVVSRLRLPLPPLDEQRKIMELVTLSSKVIATSLDSVTLEIELLREYRTRLISDVVTGKLDVREAMVVMASRKRIFAAG